MTRMSPFRRDVVLSQNQGEGWVGLFKLWELCNLCLRASGSNDFTKALEHHEGWGPNENTEFVATSVFYA